ncbi:MAG: rhodanese-like domain-containing protein [Actinomycetia bacterium]|nr:rhodanese-like domain-containing protein [Actinomycetes bacterium]
MKHRTKLLLAGLGLGAVIIAGCSSGASAVETVAPADAAQIITTQTDEIILDIRTPDEFSQGVIEGAINIDFYDSDFADQLDALDKDARYVVYCRSGSRSGQARATFEELGFTNVTEIDGGIANWYNDGLPVVLP